MKKDTRSAKPNQGASASSGLLKPKTLLVVAGLIFLTALTWLVLGQKSTPGSAGGNPSGGGSPQGAKVTQGGKGGAGEDATGSQSRSGRGGKGGSVDPAKVQALTTIILDTLKRFKVGKVDADTARKMLAELDRVLREADGATAGAAIVAFLETGEDATTGLDFIVGEGGVLEEAPTLRTAMLDKLGQMSSKDATEYAHKIFEQARSPDEWAVNMRNLAWNNDDNRFTSELGNRVEQMLDRKDWLEKPSIGFLEAFDLSVYLGGAQQVANMASVLGLGLPNGLDHAAFISLDRLTLREPDTVFNYLQQDPNFMSWAPDVRASLMARATDTKNGVQRQTLENYMANPNTTAEEFHQFAQLYPHRSYTLGSRLVTSQEEAPGLKEMAQYDMQSLDMVRQWMSDPRFSSRREDLGAVERRLLEYQKQIDSAKKDGSLK